MRLGEAIAVVAGVACVVVASIQAIGVRPYEWFLLARVALIAIGVSGRQLRKLALGPSGV